MSMAAPGAAALALGGVDELPDDAPAAVLRARMAALVQALRSADTAEAAADEIITLVRADGWDTPQRPRTCAALVKCGAVDALLQVLRPAGAPHEASLCALNVLLGASQDARLAAHVAGGVAVMLRLLQAGGTDDLHAARCCCDASEHHVAEI
jgi:hypothetical protein